MSPLAKSTIASVVLLGTRSIVFGQAAEDSNTPVRVTMSVNQDGSRTVYKFNDAKHTATATATDADGNTSATGCSPASPAAAPR